LESVDGPSYLSLALLTFIVETGLDSVFIDRDIVILLSASLLIPAYFIEVATTNFCPIHSSLLPNHFMLHILLYDGLVT
jgi:hypothetical protein